MNDINVEYPPRFDEYAWEVQAKGWLPGVVGVIQGRRYSVTVYDKIRLAQDVDDSLKRGDVFMERNLLVVRSVTRENIAAAFAEIVRTGRVGDLQPDEERPEQGC